MTLMGRWAAEAERMGFASVGVIDRLMHDNLAVDRACRGGGVHHSPRADEHHGERVLAKQRSIAGQAVGLRSPGYRVGDVSLLAEALRASGTTAGDGQFFPAADLATERTVA
jgi:hypothetical protein